MAFGNAVTEFAQVAIGSYGYIIRVNVTELRANKINSIQIQSGTGDTDAPVANEVSSDVIKACMSNANCPDAAFNYSSGECLVFLKASVYGYVASTRIAFDGLRDSQDASADTDFLDIPAKDMGYLWALCLEKAYKVKQLNVPQNIREQIEVEEERIRNES